MYHDKKTCRPNRSAYTPFLVQASKQVIGFAEQIQKLEVNLSISGRAHSRLQVPYWA